MKKFLTTIAFFGMVVGMPLVAQENRAQEMKQQELCHFAEDVFQALSEEAEQRRMATYGQSHDPIIQDLAKKFTASWKEGASIEELQAAISELGRLIKCSADAEYHMPYTLHKKELQELTASMEVALQAALPNNPNYHKLMIESLADEKWNVAFYSYLKIAEDRCTD